MHCREVLAVMDDVVTGVAPGRVARRLQEHIADCPTCRQAHERAVATWTVLRSEPPVLDVERRTRVLNRFRAGADSALAQPKQVVVRRPLLRRIAAAGLSLAAVGGVLAVLVNTTARVDHDGGMPTADDLVTMSFLHAAHSEALTAGSQEMLRVSLVDARIPPAAGEMDEK